MDMSAISQMTTEQLQGVIDARNAAALDPFAAVIDARAGMAMAKPAGQWTSDDSAAVRARILAVLRSGW